MCNILTPCLCTLIKCNFTTVLSVLREEYGEHGYTRSADEPFFNVLDDIDDTSVFAFIFCTVFLWNTRQTEREREMKEK